MQTFLVLAVIIASVSAFNAPARVQSSFALKAFNFGKKSSPAKVEAPTFKINEGSANKGTYIPAGLTKEQYDKVLAEEAKKAEGKKKKFFIGKEAETLTEWMLACEAKGLKGKDMLLKGHRMVKAKYEEFYTNESPV